MSETKVSGANVKVGAKSDQGKTTDSSQELYQRAAQFCPYRVVSIQKEDWEASRADDNWYKYVVDNGKSTIIGHRRGPPEQVKEHAERFVAELNARGGRVRDPIWPSRRGRPAQTSTETDHN